MFDATLFHLEHLVYLMLGAGLLFSKESESKNPGILLWQPGVIAFVGGLVAIHLISLDYRIGIFWYFPTQ